MKDDRFKVVARVYQVGDDEMPILEGYIYDDVENPFRERVRFTDEKLAEAMGLKDAVIDSGMGNVTVDNGLAFIRSMWKFFSGTSNIMGDQAVKTRSLIAPTRPERKSDRGEPKMDPMEDIEGQYRRFQQREQEL